MESLNIFSEEEIAALFSFVLGLSEVREQGQISSRLSSQLSIDDFFEVLRGPLSPRHKAMIRAVFTKLQCEYLSSNDKLGSTYGAQALDYLHLPFSYILDRFDPDSYPIPEDQSSSRISLSPINPRYNTNLLRSEFSTMIQPYSFSIALTRESSISVYDLEQYFGDLCFFLRRTRRHNMTKIGVHAAYGVSRDLDQIIWNCWSIVPLVCRGGKARRRAEERKIKRKNMGDLVFFHTYILFIYSFCKLLYFN